MPVLNLAEGFSFKKIFPICGELLKKHIFSCWNPILRPLYDSLNHLISIVKLFQVFLLFSKSDISKHKMLNFFIKQF